MVRRQAAVAALLALSALPRDGRAQVTTDGAPMEALERLQDTDNLQMDSTWQPRVLLRKRAGPEHGRCTGVDSIRLTSEGVRIVGFKSNGSSPDDVTAHLYRRGAGIILDIIGVSIPERMMTVSCFTWEAAISGLHPGTFALTVRQTDDPKGPAHSRVLAYTILDTGTKELWRIVPVPQ